MKIAAVLVLLFCLVSGRSLAAQTAPAVVVLNEPGFPAADAATPSEAELRMLIPGAGLASQEQLQLLLLQSTTRVLVLPYGSAFPEAAWPNIDKFLERGGSLLVIGGRPFTRAAYRSAAGWQLRDYSVRFARELLIDQYQETPGSEELEFQTNPDVMVKPGSFTWKRSFSPILHLSAGRTNEREGSAGSIDARLDALAWGTRDGRRLAAPVIQIDHLQNRFSGGRWIFVNAELPPDFYGSAQAKQLIPALVGAALRGSEEFTVRPTLPLYLPGEPVQLEIAWNGSTAAAVLSARVTVKSELQQSDSSAMTVQLPAAQPVVLTAPSSKGFHIIEAELREGEEVRAVYRSGFWIRDETYLRSGPRLSMNRDYFELDGHPLAVAGTTYMASDVQRLFFEHPNVYVWDRDLGQIKAAGLNMLRTGWWSGWDKFCDENGQPYERTLRTLEAYLMTARKHDLPVQFTFFAFLPEVLGGENAYLDPAAIRKQQTMVSSVVGRFHDVPFLVWDLINEPSFSRYFWETRPNGDPTELAKWNEWLSRRYPDRAALANAWNIPINDTEGVIALPAELDFKDRSANPGRYPLRVYDYFLFTQESFANWVRGIREAIRATGSQQPITVGQDEGGNIDRLSPAFFSEFVDFTTNHSWWENDSLLWDCLVAKQPGMPMLIQETGIQPQLALDGIARRTAENEAELLERKLAMSLVQGSGAIQWLWHTNAYMTEGNEVYIGALRADRTEKPEAEVMRKFAKFSKSLQNSLRNPRQPQVAIVTSQAEQFSPLGNLQLEAQQKAVRALAYYARMSAYIVAENQIEKLGSPSLAILPSPQALNETTWRALLRYVSGGGNLLITGPVDRDQHWQRIERAAALGLNAQTEPVTYRNAEIRIEERSIPLSFDREKQTWLEALRFGDGGTLKEVSYGKGHIFVAAYPVELAENLQSAVDLYSYVLGRLDLRPQYELNSELSPGVLIYPIVLQDSVLYVVVSESAQDAKIDLRDKATGTRLTFPLAAQHATLMLVRKSDGAVLSKY